MRRIYMSTGKAQSLAKPDSSMDLLRLLLLVGYLVKTNDAKKLNVTEPLSHGYSSKSTQELSNEYQHDRVLLLFKNAFVFVLAKK